MDFQTLFFYYDRLSLGIIEQKEEKEAVMDTQLKKLVVITGMSGAGKTIAMQSFEDLGYYCIDNLPPALLSDFWKLVQKSEGLTEVCLVIDVRSGKFFKELTEMLKQVDDRDLFELQVLFLEASDSVLVARYKESRRNHPLQSSGQTVLEGIQHERQALQNIRNQANMVIDTSNLSGRELRETITREFHSSKDNVFTVEMMSFGFKYGLPIDSDLVMDVRFLPNPYYIDSLRGKTGLDKPVYDYVMSQPIANSFYEDWKKLVTSTLPLYKEEGKGSLTIAVGCTGGQHRSVAMAERLGHDLEKEGYRVHFTHRDIEKSKNN